jgi:hypothetical protein
MRLLGVIVLVSVLAAASALPGAGAAPSSGCRTVTVTYRDGTQKPMLAPPTPNGTVTRLRGGRFRFTWRFATLPAECRPSRIALGLKFKPPLTIIPFKRPVRAKSGTYTTFPLPEILRPKVIYGLLWAEAANGLLSESRRVPLRRV